MIVPIAVVHQAGFGVLAAGGVEVGPGVVGAGVGGGEVGVERRGVAVGGVAVARSEERRGGKEWRSRGAP